MLLKGCILLVMGGSELIVWRIDIGNDLLCGSVYVLSIFLDAIYAIVTILLIGIPVNTGELGVRVKQVTSTWVRKVISRQRMKISQGGKVYSCLFALCLYCLLYSVRNSLFKKESIIRISSECVLREFFSVEWNGFLHFVNTTSFANPRPPIILDIVHSFDFSRSRRHYLKEI